MIQLTKKTIEQGQIVIVVDSSYRLPGMKDSPWYKPSTELTAYADIGTLNTFETKLVIGEKLEIIGIVKGDIRGVTYKRVLDGNTYSSYLGEFTTFVRLM